MKKIISILFTIFIFNFLSGQCVDKSEFKFVNNYVFYKGSIYTGCFTSKFNNGNIESKGFLIDGQLDSILYEYNGNGELISETWYNHNNEVRRRLYRDAFSTKIIVNLVGNTEDGLWERYYRNGQLAEQNTYDNGKIIGISSKWDKKGRLIYKEDFTGDTIIQEFHDYKWGKHRCLVKYYEKETLNLIKKEKTSK